MKSIIPPLVSIIVPVYNVEQYLRTCIISIKSQSYVNWELILVDDGSPDNCPQICDEYAANDNRIHVIHKKNGGLSSARNAGLEIVTGDYIYFLDSDDFLHSNTFKDIIKIAQDMDADIVQHSYIGGQLSIFPQIVKNPKLEYYDNRSIFWSKRQKIIMCGKLYRRALWDGIRMPVGKINEDDFTSWKLYHCAKKIVYVDTPYYYYTENPSSIMSEQKKTLRLDFIDAYKERISFFEQKGDNLMLSLSKWRFCLPLMMGYMRGNVKNEDLPILLDCFYKNYKAAIFCNKVRLGHRILIAMFSCCPKLFRKLFEIMGKAHTL